MNLQGIGLIISVTIGGLTLLQKITTLISSVNKVLESVDTNSKNIEKLSKDMCDNNILTKKIADEQEKIAKSTMDVIRQHIIEKTNDVISRGYITEEELYVLNELYDDYKKFNGNSTIDTRYKLSIKLPIGKNRILEG